MQPTQRAAHNTPRVDRRRPGPCGPPAHAAAAGLVSLFRGAPAGDVELADAWATWTGASLADEAGVVLRADADAGAWSLADSNLLWVGDTWAEAGDTLDAADVDGDGAAELLLGAQEWDPLRVRGAAWLLPGGLR